MSDFPDWFGQPQFPRYGGATFAWDFFAVAPNVNQSIVSITGKGVLYSANISTKDYITALSDIFRLFVDGVGITSGKFRNLRDNALFRPIEGYFHMPLCDDTIPKYIAIFTTKITFDSSVEIRYEEESGNDPQVRGELVYSLIG